MRALTSVQGDTVDALIWRELRLAADQLGAVFALNPGLAALGPVLPIGTKVLIPDAAVAAATSLPLIQLWD